MKSKGPVPAADSLSGGLVVSGDDDDADSGVTALLDGLQHLYTGRVQHANNAHEGAVSLKCR